MAKWIWVGPGGSEECPTPLHPIDLGEPIRDTLDRELRAAMQREQLELTAEEIELLLTDGVGYARTRWTTLNYRCEGRQLVPEREVTYPLRQMAEQHEQAARNVVPQAIEHVLGSARGMAEKRRQQKDLRRRFTTCPTCGKHFCEQEGA